MTLVYGHRLALSHNLKLKAQILWRSDRQTNIRVVVQFDKGLVGDLVSGKIANVEATYMVAPSRYLLGTFKVPFRNL